MVLDVHADRAGQRVPRDARRARYLPIAEHGLIGDLHTVALVGIDGTIDWYCCPRFDSPSVFGAILDADQGGLFRIARNTHHRSPVRVRQQLLERPHPPPLLDEPFGRDGADGAMHPLVDALAPAVELQLKVQLVGEPPPRLEVGAHEPMRALEQSLGLRVTRVEDHPADAELPAERGERIGRAPAAGDRGLPVPHELLGQRANPTQATAQAPQDVRRLLGEDQRAGDHARPAQLRGDDPTAPGLAMPDRHRRSRLPQIALHQLPRPIDRALKGALDQEP
jgi:trehalase-like protein